MSDSRTPGVDPGRSDSGRMDVAPGTIAVFSDVGCPWASLATHRLRAHRSALGLDGVIEFDHRAFPLELINRRPTPKRVLDAEIAAIAAIEPALEWVPWYRPESSYPVTTLLPMEAVQAAKAAEVGGLRASDDLDAALRHAFYAQSRTISLLPVVLEVAGQCATVAADALEVALHRGSGRAEVIAQWRRAGAVRGSPHLFSADGSDIHNPGIRLSWTGEPGRSFVRIDRDDPSVYDELLRRAAVGVSPA